MKKVIRIHCRDCGKKLIKAFRYGWFNIRERGLHCPHCKKFYRLNGESLVDAIIALVGLGFFLLGIALLIIALTSCTPY
jgi:phage FluMu protein Com